MISLQDCMDDLNKEKTYLDIAYSEKDGRYATRWANNAVGSMVDMMGDGVLRFIDYYYEPPTDGKDMVLRSNHSTEEEELACPIVAEGIVVYWLKYRNQKGVPQIFEEYYNQCMQRYVQRNEKMLNACERDLPREFAKRWHISYEMGRIDCSEAIFPYLNKEQVDEIKKLTDYYYNFIRKKAKELFPPQYTLGSEKTEAFLHVYETTAKKCVDWICDEYNLPPMGPHWGDDRGRKIYDHEWYDNNHNKVEPRYIRWGYMDFETRDLYYKNSEIMEEINVNLGKCIDQDARVRYVIKLLSSFKEFAQPFYPMGKIKEWKQSIEEHKKWKADWEKVADDAVDEETGKPLNPQEEIKAYDESIAEMEADIKYWNEKARKLYDICQEAIHHQKVGEYASMELCLEGFWRTMIYFYRRLTALLLTYKLRLMDIQKKCGVYLNWEARLTDYVDGKYVTSYDYASQLLHEIEGTGTEDDDGEENEGTKNRKTNVFDYRLNENKIAGAVKKLNRCGLGQIDFTYAVQECFESLDWLSDTMDTRFVAWMKKHKIISMKTEDLKKANFDSRSEEVQNRLLKILQEINEKTGKPKDKIYFYNKTNAKLINDGEE